MKQASEIYRKRLTMDANRPGLIVGLAGFRVEEIKQLFHGFGRGIPASRRWQLLARRKITEFDEQIASARKMKRLLENADRCKCVDLENCGSVFLAHSPEETGRSLSR